MKATASIIACVFFASIAGNATGAGFDRATPALDWNTFLEQNRRTMLIAAQLENCRLPELARQVRARLTLSHLQLIEAWADGARTAFGRSPAVDRECADAVIAADRFLQP